MIKNWLASSAAVTALLIVRAAAAQPQYTAQSNTPQWLTDRRYTEGIGIRTGDLELHPGVGGEVGYDSNWFYRSTQPGVANGAPLAPVIPALTFQVTPSLYLSTMTAQRMEGGHAEPPTLAFRGGINATIFGLVGISSDPVAKITSNDINRIDATGSADARLDILPGRPVGGAVGVTYGRVVFPNAVNGVPDFSFSHDDISANAELAIQPGSGTLDWHFGYQFATSLFERDIAKGFTNYTHQAFVRGRWRFRPRTALVYDATLGWNLYAFPGNASNLGLVESTPVRTRIGLTGLITDRFALLAMIGWGASFVSNPVPQMQQYDSLIANAELKWFLAASPGISKATELGLTLSSIAVGYTRDFQGSYLANFDGVDRGYLRFNYFFAGRAVVGIEAGVAAIEYPHLYWLNGQGRGVLLHDSDNATAVAPARGVGFTDVRADAAVFGEYRFSDTLGLNSTFRYGQNFSNARVEIAQPGPPPSVPPPGTIQYFGMAWQRFEVLLGFRWFM
jgi:hypothetical protein